MSDKKTNDSASEGVSSAADELGDLLRSLSSSKPAWGGGKESHGHGGANLRKHYRHPVRWRVAVVNKSGGHDEIYHGRTYDISLSGISILLDHNMLFTPEVVVLLAIPPTVQGLRETIIEAQCAVMYTVLDSEHHQFRLGMRFVHFKGEGKRILTDVLSKRHIPKQEPGSYHI